MDKQYYPINEEAARRAKEAYSFSDYKPDSATEDYRGEVDRVWELVEKRIQKGDLLPEQTAKLGDYADRYASRYASWKNRYNANTASCPSVMICGAGNFPTKKKEKQNAREDRLWQEYEDIQKYLKWIEGYTVSTAIKAGDADAVQQIEDKLQKLVDKQEEMKAANAYYRKNKTMKGYISKGGVAYTDEQTAKLDEAIKNAFSFDQQPYAAYMLTNNNGKIKHTRDRLAQLKSEKATESREYDTAGLDITVEENKDIMRLQVFFEGKPDEATRTLLKSHAFKWAPSVGCWQRQLTNNARHDLKNIIEKLKEVI
jgi:hypothetical protein